MALIKYSNGITYKYQFLTYTLKLSKTYRLTEGKRRTFLYQINRFENGFVTVYVRVFYKYSLSFYGIKLKEGKRFFFGNKELT